MLDALPGMDKEVANNLTEGGEGERAGIQAEEKKSPFGEWTGAACGKSVRQQRAVYAKRGGRAQTRSEACLHPAGLRPAAK